MFDGANLVLTAALLLSIPLLGTCMVLAARIPGRGKVGVIAFLIIQAILAGYGVVARFVVVSLQSLVPEAMLLLNLSTSGLRIVGWVMLAWGLYEWGQSTAPKRQDSEAEFWHR